MAQSIDISAPKPKVNFNASPKERFLGWRTTTDKHMALIERPEFDTALDFALLQYNWQITQRAEEAPGAAYFKLLGVHEFIYTLRNLGRQPQIPTSTPKGNLNHSV